MALVAQRRQIGMEKTTVPTTVPSNDKARLMYYLNCICCVINIDSDGHLKRLRDYKNWSRLTDGETTLLLQTCALLDPSELNGKCIFLVDSDATDNNDFYKLTDTRITFAAASSVLIGGKSQRVTKIMVYNEGWLRRNYFGPLPRLLESVRAAQRRRQQRQYEQQRDVSTNSSACTIL